jgi:magnesium transporter
MISIYKHIAGKIGEIRHIEDDCWINVVNPGEAEIKSLAEQTGVPQDFLTDALDIDERARIETEDGSVLIVVHTHALPERGRRHPLLHPPPGHHQKGPADHHRVRQENEVVQHFLEGRSRIS